MSEPDSNMMISIDFGPESTRNGSHGGGVRLVSIVGQSSKFASSRYWQEVFAGLSITLSLGFAVLMALLNPGGISEYSLRYCFWIAIVFMYLGAYFIVNTVFSYILKILETDRFFVPLGSLIVVPAVFFAGRYLSEFMEVDRVPLFPDGIRQLVCYYLAEQFLFALYIGYKEKPPFVLNGNGKIGQDLLDEDQLPRRNVYIAGHSFPHEELLYISSEGHYLYVATQGDCKKLRGRLRDVLQLIGSGDCFAIHRSHCVMRNGIKSYGETGAALTVTMQNGANFRVAASKRDAFLSWMLQPRA